jgi:hypothetical protein
MKIKMLQLFSFKTSALALSFYKSRSCFFFKKKLGLVVPNYKNPLARNEKLSGG